MSNQIIVGQVIGNEDDGYQRLISITDIHNATSIIGYNYETKVIMSLDGLFVPFSTDPNEENLPHFESGFDNDLNPMNVATMQILSPSDEIPENFYKSTSSYYKGIALRGPIIISGWGFDTDGNPVPNEDPEDPTDNFLNGYLTKSNMWKTGPLDVRWNNSRKTWEATVDSANLSKLILTSGLSDGGDGTAIRESDNVTVDIDNFLAQRITDGSNCIGWRISVGDGESTNDTYIIIQSQFYEDTVITNVECNGDNLVVTSGNIYTQS